MDRKELERYIEENFATTGEFPFEKHPDTCVFRHGSNRKWFAVVMEIPRSRLGLTGEDTVLILNTKCDFILINSFLSENGFYPAYHMNKSHWITTLLDGTVDSERIKGLLEISFDLTNVKRKKQC